MPNSVVELVIRAVDQATAPLQKIGKTLDGITQGVLGVNLGTAASFFGVTKTLQEVISASSEAEQSMVKFNRAFKAFGETLGVSKKEMLDFASATQATSRFSDDAVRDMQTKLAQFGTITGDTFRRAQQAAVDLAAGMGMDLPAAATIVARSMVAPEQSMRLLRQAGINLSDSQKALIKDFGDTGRQADAMNLILGEIEKRFGGAAKEDINTYAGALENLKNAFGELFEANIKPVSSGLNSLAETLRNPDFVNAAQTAFSALATTVGLVAKSVNALAAGLDLLANKGRDTWNPIATALGGYGKLITFAGDVGELADSRLGTGRYGSNQLTPEMAARVAALGGAANAKAAASIADGAFRDFPIDMATPKILNTGAVSEIDTAALKSVQLINNIKGFNAAFKAIAADMKSTETEFQSQLNRREELIKKIRFQQEQGLISQELANAQIEEANEKVKDYEVTARKIPEHMKLAKEASEAQLQAIRNVHDAFNGAINSWITGASSFKDAFIGALRQIITNAAANQFMKLLGFGAGEGNKNTGFAAFISGAIGKLFGRASGGQASGWGIAGEEGPELVNYGSGAQVFNKRQMAFAGIGGSSVNFQPQTAVTIQARSEDAASLRQEFAYMLQLNNQNMQRQWLETMRANGFGRLS